MASYIKRSTQVKGIGNLDFDANIWLREGCEWRVEMGQNEEFYNLSRTPNIEYLDG